MKIKKIISAMFFTIIGLLLVISCSDSNTTAVTPKNEPPKLPSAKSVTFDFSIFDIQAKANAKTNTTQAQSNYEQAAESIGQIQAVNKFAAEPVIQLLMSADSSDAQNIGDGKWEWNYQNKESKINAGVRLVATQKDDGTVGWKFYVTNDRSPQDQLLISGPTNAEVTKGTWTYYTPSSFSQAQQEFADLKWNIDENDDANITLKVVADIAGNSFKGSTLDYQTKGTIRHFVLNDTKNNKKTTIEFDAESKVGFIIDPDYNNDEQACWDSNYDDVACTNIDL